MTSSFNDSVGGSDVSYAEPGGDTEFLNVG